MSKNGKEVAIVRTNGNTPQDMIRLAVDKGTDLTKLRELLEIQKDWEANEARKAYHEAMAGFKANPPKINKDKKVGYKTSTGNVGYSHASLANVTEKINSELSKYGLSASWTTKQNGAIAVTCKITHKQGHSEECTLSAPSDTSGSKNAVQAIGSTMTYLERYTLLALTGLATFDQDDDGQAVVTEFISEKELSQLLDLIADKEVTLDKFLEYLKIESLERMPKSKYVQAFTALANKKKAGAK